jgi:AraC family transcriptional regulator
MFEAPLTCCDGSTLAHEPALWPAASIRIDYLGSDDLGGTRIRNSLDILLPTATANLFATYRSAGARERTAFVRAPLVAIVPPGLPHSLADAPGRNTLVLSIPGPFFSEVALAALEGAGPTLREPHATPDALIREVGNTVENDVRSRRPLGPRYLESLAAVLAAHVARHHAAAADPKSTPCGGLAPHKLQRVRGFVAEHLSETIRVEQLAAAAHLSAFHFARMFKQSTGHTPHLYILLQRIGHARQLLAGTDTPLVDVATQVGFHTQGHFTGVFHRYTGLTPRAFRLHAREAAATSGAPADPATADAGCVAADHWSRP